MYNLRKIGRVMLSAVVAVTFSTSAAVAGTNTDSDTATASAKVVQPISITPLGGGILGFGKFIAPGIGDGNGTVTVDPVTNLRTASSNVVLLNDISVYAAAFRVNGETGESYLPSFPPSVQIKDGSNEMTVHLFTSHPNGGTRTLVSGFEYISVGATLQIDENQAGGEYSGDFDVTVTYQ